MNEPSEHVQVNGAVPVPASGPGILAPLSEPPKQAHYQLSDKQRDFFLRQRQAMSNIEMGMRGALQMLVEEHGLSGKVTLSEDCSELIAEQA